MVESNLELFKSCHISRLIIYSLVFSLPLIEIEFIVLSLLSNANNDETKKNKKYKS